MKAGVYSYPAMIGAFGLDVVADRDQVQGVHLTFLSKSGRTKANVETKKITLGPSRGFPIVIAAPTDALAITEGIEDALTVHEATGMGAWAAGCAGRLPLLADKIPNHVETVTIFAHSDDAGMKGALALADALVEREVEIRIEVGATDINDELQENGIDAVRERADRARSYP
jgi:hypothetical protein